MPVRTERCGRVLTVVLSRPSSRNAIDPEHADALHAAFLAFASDDTADVAVLWGEGGAFSAGADLKNLAARGIANTENTATHRSLAYPSDDSPVPRGPMGPTRLHLDKPVIAAIEGPAVGGGMELALWADCRVMAEGSFMGVYSRRVGVPLTDGGTVRLPRIVGQGRALEILMTGRRVEADECLRIGLCEKLVQKDQARDAAEKMAAQILVHPQACLRADRRSLYRQHGSPESEAIKMEWYNCTGVFDSDGAQGSAAFASRRIKGQET